MASSRLSSVISYFRCPEVGLRRPFLEPPERTGTWDELIRRKLRTFLASDYDAQRAPERANLLLASHSGELPGFHSCMTLFLDHTWTVILLDNHDSKSLPSLAAEIINALLTRSPDARSTSAP